MNSCDLSKAKNADLRASFAAMQRAAKSARQLALQTNTSIVIVQNGKLVRLARDDRRGFE